MHAIPEPIAVEARAKIMWGESTAKVHAFLMSKHVGEKDAATLLEEILSERAAVVRSRGVKKVWLGIFLSSGAIIYYVATSGRVSAHGAKGFATLIVAAAVGVALITNGLSMLLRPRAVRSDLSNGAF